MKERVRESEREHIATDKPLRERERERGIEMGMEIEIEIEIDIYREGFIDRDKAGDRDRGREWR